MGCQPLQLAAVLSILGWSRTYTSHDDPAAAVANLIAVVVGANGPFYPLYIVHCAGRAVLGESLLTTLASPFFLMIPLVTRRSSRMGRLALPMVGTINTIWCLKLLGPETGVELFLLPCIALAALLFRPSERFLLLLAAILSFAAVFLSENVLGRPLISLDAPAAAGLAALNVASVAALVFLMTLKFAGLFQRLDFEGGRESRHPKEESP